MNDLNREEKDGRDPEYFLRIAKDEEAKKKRGRLTVFLGYSAGVGKTYAMLEDARRRQSTGVDVVIGCLLTHGRRETERLKEGLEEVPMRPVEHRGVRLEEMDIDAVLARRPQLALVDELAHTNVVGSRHAKRYQDVLELLESGIDVHTTLNIQHVESMNDAVEQVTGVRVRETIPDTVLDSADEIKVVDIPPKELIQRLIEGKVYLPEQVASAIGNFFNEGNLIALREMTLRSAAEHVDGQMLAYMRSRFIEGPWPVSEKILVCVGDSEELNDRLVRAGKRLSDETRGEWHAIYVETPANNRLVGRSHKDAIKGLDFAASLGAKTAVSVGLTIADEVVRYAKANNITMIIVGRQRQSIWGDLIFRPLINQLVEISSDYDLMVITSHTAKVKKEMEDEGPSLGLESFTKYFYCTWLVLAFTILDWIVDPVVEDFNLIMVYLIGVVVAAALWGLRTAVFTAFTSIIMFNFFFLTPRLTFHVGDSQYVVALLVFLLVGVVISILVVKSRDNALSAQRREEYSSTQYMLSLDLVKANSLNAVLTTMESHILNVCKCSSAYLLPVDGELVLAHASDGLVMTGKEMTAARWTFTHGSASGRGTDTLSSAELKFYPIRTDNRILGVIGIKWDEKDSLVLMEREKLIQSFTNQAGLAIERIALVEQLQKKG